jgi:hypothetical protein
MNTESRKRVWPDWERYEFPEAKWCVLLVQAYRRTFTWRQVPFQVSASEVAEEMGEEPRPPRMPPEPPNTDSEAWLMWQTACARKQAEWERLFQAGNNRKLQVSQGWDLTPVPEWEPVSTLPPHLRDYLPVERFERAIHRQQSFVPQVESKWVQRWNPRNQRFESFQEQSSRSVSRTEEREGLRSLGSRMVSVPETLIVVVPSVDLLDFLSQSDRGALVLVRVRLDIDRTRPEGEEIVSRPVPGSELVLNSPGLDIVASSMVDDPLAFPLADLDGLTLPRTQAEYDKILGSGEETEVPRADGGGPCRISLVPREWHRLAALNIAWQDAQSKMSDGPFWRPVLQPRESEPPSLEDGTGASLG